MTANETIGQAAGLWRFPVKSMLGEQVDSAEITATGMTGDRAYALIDGETGKVVSAKSTRLFPDMFGCRAGFVEEPEGPGAMPAVRITLPDGSSVTSDAPDADAALSRWFGRDVHLAAAAPEDFTIDQYHPDVEDLDPEGHRDTVVEQKLGAALFAELGIPSPVPVGAFFDLWPLTLLTTGTLEELARLEPASRFDARRFRMNVIVATGAPGFFENDWVGAGLEVGEAVRVRVTMPDPRCVMTTLAQEDLERDNGILRTLTRHNRLPVGGAGLYPCAGVYAFVESPGTIRAGDPVRLRR